MALTPGSRLGQYEVKSQIGAGGMGEVYRAHDTKLGRDVALKVLPELLAADPERLARFRREAQLLASLNHPHIAAIYGVEESDDVHALVLELVEGPTLAECIERGSLSQVGRTDWSGRSRGLSLDETLPIARQLTEALESAHDQGVVHRDLKPSNIKVMLDGTVKILDFGLAKALSTEAELERAEDPDSSSPTITAMGTRAGTILGTAGYMSPEQARGARVDRRTDIWAFGAVLFEMLTGRQAFGGQTVTDALAAVLRAELDWQALPPATPPGVRKLLRYCLEKDPKRRLPHIGAARLEIDDVLAATADTTAVADEQPPWRRALPWTIAAVAVVIASVLTWNLTRAPGPDERVTRLSVAIPADTTLTDPSYPNLAVSPDGSRLAFTTSFGEAAQLYVREMDELEATLIPGTEGALAPFFSPDGQWVGFAAGGQLKKVSIDGGAPMVLADVGAGWGGGAWGQDDTIVYSPDYAEGLRRISANGGESERLTTPDEAAGELGHWYPQRLPDGDGVLFTVYATPLDNARIDVLSLTTGERRTLVEGATFGRYVPTGHLVYPSAGNSLMAVPFDVATLEVTGSPVPVLDDVVLGVNGNSQFSFADDGAFAYVPASTLLAGRMLAWVDRDGTTRPVTEERRRYESPRLSSDGELLALDIEEAGADVWVHEMARGTLTKLTFGEGLEYNATWTADDGRIIFNSEQPSFDLFWKLSDGSGDRELLFRSQYDKWPSSVSRDGTLLAYTESHPDTSGDIWVLPLDEARKPEPFLQTPFDEGHPVFSPDGQWLAYQSNESGRFEIYVQSYPGLGGKQLISTDGGTGPLWAEDGQELFYRNGQSMMVVPIQTDPDFAAGNPSVLFEGDFEPDTRARNYDVTADNQQFVMVAADPDAPAPHIEVVLNWFEELREKAPTGQ